MARVLTGEDLWHIRAQHELDLLLLASEGQVNQALDAFEALYADGWHWLSGPGTNYSAREPIFRLRTLVRRQPNAGFHT